MKVGLFQVTAPYWVQWYGIEAPDGEIELTEEEIADWQRVAGEFGVWQQKMTRLKEYYEQLREKEKNGGAV